MVSTIVAGFHDDDAVKKMTYNSLGNTGLKISKLSIGGAAFGGLNTYGDYEKSEAEETVVDAIKKGINYIDVAPHYGFGVAEAFLGEVLPKIPRQAYYISTKVGRMGNVFNYGRDGIMRSFEESLKRLKLDFVDIVFVHDVEFAESIDLIVEETLPAVEDLRKQGKVKFIGISGYPLFTLQEVIRRSRVKISCVLSYARDTLIDNTLQDFLPFFKNMEVGVINASCVGMRLLCNEEPPNWHPALHETKRICAEAADYCKERGIELGRLAIYYSLQQPGSTTCLVGMNSREILTSNLGTLYNGLSTDELDALQHVSQKILSPDKKHNWEGVEIALLRKTTKKD